jgi:tRNA pseudouridine55 synthase
MSAMEADAVLLVDKPAGRTSHDIVAEVRRGLPRDPGAPRPKVGHAGTLDPFATGLLLVLTGRATRVQRFLMALPKTYVTRARFGAVSTTGDPEGEILETGRVPAEPLVLPTGVVRQRPPAYSAIKVAGERAYALARRGEAVELPERDVVVHRFERLGPDEFAIECSAGTYVRSLIADLGDAYCTELRRTAIGPFDVREAGRTIPLGDALAAVMPVRGLAGDDARRAAHGLAVAGVADADGPLLLTDDDGPIAVAEARPGGLLKPIVGFRG